MNSRKGAAALLAACALFTGCSRREPVTMNLEEVRLNRYADAVVQTMNEYQVIRTKRCLYPGLGSWLDANRTASIYQTDPGKLRLFTEGEDEGYQWREVYYSYGFYDAKQMQGSEEGGGLPLLIAPMLLAADVRAIAYQTMDENGYALAVSEEGKKTVFLKGEESVRTTDPLWQDSPYSWNKFEYAWSSDGNILFYYKMADPVAQEGFVENGETDPGRNTGIEEAAGAGQAGGERFLTLPYGVYSYDRASGQTRRVWDRLKIEMPSVVYRSPSAETVVADTREGVTALFLLFDERSGCPDVLLWGGESEPQIQFLSLPENPCIQPVLEEEAYYYQEDGRIQKARLGATGQPELLVYTDPGLKSFLVSSDGQKVFTVEERGDTEDICLYICDERKNWYKQILYVGATGTRSIQLSADGLTLLVEGEIESASQLTTQSQALILEFYHGEEAD